MPYNQSARSIIEYIRILNLLFTDLVEHNITSKITSVPLTKNQYAILKLLKITGPILVNNIADLMQFSCAAASKNVDTLVNLKLISRKIISRDRRKAKISILEEGEKIVEDFEGNINKKQLNSLISFSKKEQQQLSNLLGKYVKQYLSQDSDIDLICLKCDGKIYDKCVLINYNVKCRFNIVSP
jgi:DNA-binding MarR family transcriptional regulator